MDAAGPARPRGRHGAARLRERPGGGATRGLTEATLTVRTATAGALRLCEGLGMTPGWAVDEHLTGRRGLSHRAG